MKKYFFTGLIALLPILITLYVLIWIVDFLTEPFMDFAKSLLAIYRPTPHHEGLLMLVTRICILVALFVFIFLLGVICQKVTKRFTLHFFSRIPFVPALYRVSKDVTKAVLSPGEKTFKESVLVPFPKDETYALGLVTGDSLPAVKEKLPEAELTVFVPTAPHPLSGYILFTSRKQAIPVSLSTEEVFKFLLSAGAVNPEEPPPDQQ
jgi:uncharacterized membrane protein